LTPLVDTVELKTFLAKSIPSVLMFILDLSFFLVDHRNSILARYEAVEKRDGSIPFANIQLLLDQDTSLQKASSTKK